MKNISENLIRLNNLKIESDEKLKQFVSLILEKIKIPSQADYDAIRKRIARLNKRLMDLEDIILDIEETLDNE